MDLYKINSKYDKTVSTLASAFDICESSVREAITRSYIFDADETNDRLRRVLCKAARGERITIAGIGGSMTEQLDDGKSWFQRTVDWFKEQFPKTTVNGIDAGIGATSSFLGTFRLDQMVLDHKPDLVMVEFSVNDYAAIPNLLNDEILEAYESIVRRCLEAGIAVIQVFFVQQQGNSMHNYHMEIANHYNVPAISYHNAVYPDGKPICDWIRLSPDDLHPNNAGHTFLGTCVANYLDLVLETTDLTVDYSLDELHTSWIYFDTFSKTYAQYAYEFKDRARGGFVFCEEVPDVCYKWRGALVSDNSEGIIKLTVPKGAKRVFVQYFNSDGSFETDFIGLKSSCDTIPTGRPKSMWHRVYTGKATNEDSNITIKSHKSGSVILQGLLIAF